MIPPANVISHFAAYRDFDAATIGLGAIESCFATYA
jgi:hypothetical protein